VDEESSEAKRAAVRRTDARALIERIRAHAKARGPSSLTMSRGAGGAKMVSSGVDQLRNYAPPGATIRATPSMAEGTP